MHRMIATWFGCGFAPVAPGTVGSLAAVVLAIPLLHHSALLLLAGALLLTPIAVWSSGVTAAQLAQKDPGLIVVDEVVGQWIALSGAVNLNWRSLLLGFALFRLFDIWKPFPARRLESIPCGFGIVADDMMAGIYASLVLFACGWFNFY